MPKLKTLVLLVFGAFAFGSVQAQEQTLAPAVVDPSQPDQEPSWLGGDGALGDFGGFRSRLQDKGIKIFGDYSVEVWGNTTGGLKRDAVSTGLLQFGAEANAGQLLDVEALKQTSFYTRWLWLSGRDASEDLVGNFLTISNIAGFNTFRNIELYVQQDFWAHEGEDALPGLRVQVGQLAADSEFIISDFGGFFINGTFGWPAFTYTNLPNGGPGYPLGAPGVRVAITPVPWFTYQAAAFQGDVFAQDVNRAGFRWRLQEDQGYFLINEAQFRWNQEDDEMGLAGQLKFGAWFHTADFAAAEGDDTYWGDSCYYAIVDQQLFREPDQQVAADVTGKDGKTATPPDGKSSTAKSFKEPVAFEKSQQGLGWFGRVSFLPQDRNFVGFYFDIGLVYTGLIPGRDDDVCGVALGYADLTDGAAQSISDDGSRDVGYEAVLEASYDVQVTKWLHVKPDLQYIIRPGGSGDLGDALVLGGRVSVIF